MLNNLTHIVWNYSLVLVLNTLLDFLMDFELITYFILSQVGSMKYIWTPMFFQFPDLETFVTDMQELCAFIADGPLKSFCFQRLSYLQSKYEPVEVICVIE